MAAVSEQLGEFLRSRRERLQPEHLGLSDPRRRRTPGLRREEVASLAGISPEWYVKLEQGRSVAPSVATIDALSRALRLNEVERAHLAMLAFGKRRPAYVRETVPESLLRFVESLPHPAYITGLRWDVLAWNEAAAALLIDFDSREIEDRNILSTFSPTRKREHCLARDGPTKHGAWSRCFALRMIPGRPILLSSTLSRVYMQGAWSLTPGGPRTTWAQPRRERRPFTAQRKTLCISTTRPFRRTMTRG